MGRMGARIGATILFTALATPAFAQGVLPLTGIFGNEAGCHLYATGTKLNDTYQLLTSDTFSSAAIGCDFGVLVSSNEASFTIDAVCSPGGKSTVRVGDLGPDGLTFSVDDHPGIVSGLKACPPTGVDLQGGHA